MNAGVAAAQNAAAVYAREQIRALASLRGSYVPHPNALRPLPPTLEVPPEALSAAHAARDSSGEDLPLAFNLSLRVPSAVAMVVSADGGDGGGAARETNETALHDASSGDGGSRPSSDASPPLTAVDRDAAIAAARVETRRLDDARLAARGLPTAAEQLRRSGKESPRARGAIVADAPLVPTKVRVVHDRGLAQSPGEALESKIAAESPGALLGAFLEGSTPVPIEVTGVSSISHQPSDLIDAGGRRVGTTAGTSDFVRMEAASDVRGGLGPRENERSAPLGGSGVPVESRASADGTVIATPAALRFGLVSVSTEGTKTLAFSIINRGVAPLRARLSDRALLGAHAREGNSVRARHDGGPIGVCVASQFSRRVVRTSVRTLTPPPPPSTLKPLPIRGEVRNFAISLLARDLGIVASTITIVTEHGEIAIPVSARVVE